MAKDDDTTGTPAPPKPEVKILRANNVEIPANWQASPADPELAQLKSAFLSGEKLDPQQLDKMMMLAERSGNGNCNIC